MNKGSYKRSPRDYTGYAVTAFNPYLFVEPEYHQAGCGATALALLTGYNPIEINQLNKGRGHYPDRFMLKFLRSNGYECIPITKSDVTNYTEVRYVISNRHVILASHLFIKTESSWLVHFNGVSYHNFLQFKIDPLDFVNKPVVTAYCISHPSWRSSKHIAGLF